MVIWLCCVQEVSYIVMLCSAAKRLYWVQLAIRLYCVQLVIRYYNVFKWLFGYIVFNWLYGYKIRHHLNFKIATWNYHPIFPIVISSAILTLAQRLTIYNYVSMFWINWSQIMHIIDIRSLPMFENSKISWTISIVSWNDHGFGYWEM